MTQQYVLIFTENRARPDASPLMKVITATDLADAERQADAALSARDLSWNEVTIFAPVLRRRRVLLVQSTVIKRET